MTGTMRRRDNGRRPNNPAINHSDNRVVRATAHVFAGVIVSLLVACITLFAISFAMIAFYMTGSVWSFVIVVALVVFYLIGRTVEQGRV